MVGGLIILAAMVRTGKPIGAFLKSSVQGILLMIAVNLTSSFTGIALAVNGLSLGFACLAGVPGVISLLLLNMAAL
nr:pro-sigmaK processing inhibitor BofA family protein [uncultured Solibaculum sp.]